MGSNSSQVQQTQCCGLIYDYKKAIKQLKIQISQYKESLGKNLNQFKGKNQRTAQTDLNRARQQAYELLKEDNQIQARKVLKIPFLKLKQDKKEGKLLTRQIDFFIKKERDLNELNSNIDTSAKPKKKSAQRNQVIKFRDKLQLIQTRQFENVDQISGDSDDPESYVDRIIEELKTRIQKQSFPVFLQPQKEPVLNKAPVYSAKQLRDKFLENLRRSRGKSGRAFRKLTKQSKLSIQLGKNLKHTENLMENSRRKKQNSKKGGFRYEQQSNPQSSIFIQLPDEDLQSSTIRSKPYHQEVGYYLILTKPDLNGYHHLEVKQFAKCDWSLVEVLDLQQCNITAFDWKKLVQAKSSAFPNLKVLYLGLNQIREVNENELYGMKGVQYLSFGWWDRSNQLSTQSKQVLQKYQLKNPGIKIQFNQF